MYLKLILGTLFITQVMLVTSSDARDSQTGEGLLLREQIFDDGRSIEQASEESRKSFSQILRQLVAVPLRQGFSQKVDWVDLMELQSEIDNVKLYLNRSNKAVIGSTNRSGGVYLTAQATVILNISLFRQLTQPKGSSQTLASSLGSEVMLIHEYLGALGYPDENYELSTYLYMRTFPNDYGAELLSYWHLALAEHLQKNPRRSKNLQFTSGTSTGIGGGGDPASAALKLITLGTLAQGKSSYIARKVFAQGEYAALIRCVLQAEIEPQQEDAAYDQRLAKSEKDVHLRLHENQARITIPTGLVFFMKTGREAFLVGDHVMRMLLRDIRERSSGDALQ